MNGPFLSVLINNYDGETYESIDFQCLLFASEFENGQTTRALILISP